jgi:hypothetical protein
MRTHIADLNDGRRGWMDSLPLLDLDALRGDGPTIEELMASQPAELSAQAAAMLRDLYRPGTLFGDLCALHVDTWATPEEREAALARLAQLVKPQMIGPELAQHVVAALLLLGDHARHRQEIRFGEVILTEYGVRVRMAPADLPVSLYLRWLKSHVFKAVVADLFGLEYPPKHSDALRRRQPLSAEPWIDETDRGESFIEQEFRSAQLARLEAKASPRQCELLRLLKEELEQQELLPLLEGEQRRADRLRGIKKAVAKRMGVTPSRVSHMLTQLRRLALGL